MLASLLCNFPFVPGPRRIKWRNRYGEFDSLEEARAAAQDAPVEEVEEIAVGPDTFIYRTPKPDTPKRRSDDDSLLFILAHI